VLIGIIFGGFITYLFAIRMNRKMQKAVAGQKLRDAFACELAVINPKSAIKNINIDSTLREALPKHMAAKTEFMFFLNKTERKAFAEAWQQYYNETGDPNAPWYACYHTDRTLFCKRVEKLFEFTQEESFWKI